MPPLIPQRMVAAQGWRYHKFGNPGKVLQFEKFRIPFDRSSNQCVVKMLAAPCHRHDKNVIEGTYGGIRAKQFPAVAGVEGVGIIEDVGSNVTLGLKEGDLVWVNNQSVGTWSTHIVTEADNLDVVPNRADVEVEFLASLSLFHTAYHLINSFVTIQPGDVILQTGATGAVSQLCTAYARSRGAKIFLTQQSGRSEHVQLVGRSKILGAHAVVPYSYVRSNYMRRLLSDVAPPKLLLNSTCGPYASQLVKLLGDDGTVVTYGSATSKPMQVANMDFIDRGLKFKSFWLPSWNATHSREARMRIHQEVIENMTLAQGHSLFRAQRFKMDSDSEFAFVNAWDAPLSSRKGILRMVGEYGEWRRPRTEPLHYANGRAVWEDMNQQMWEATGATDTPQSMKYYTPFDDWNSVFKDAQQSRELGHREVFFRRPNAPRHNTAEHE